MDRRSCAFVHFRNDSDRHASGTWNVYLYCQLPDHRIALHGIVECFGNDHDYRKPLRLFDHRRKLRSGLPGRNLRTDCHARTGGKRLFMDWSERIYIHGSKSIRIDSTNNARKLYLYGFLYPERDRLYFDDNRSSYRSDRECRP